MALVVFIRGINVWRPPDLSSVLARGLGDYGVMNVGAAGTFVVRKPGSRAKFRAALLRKLPFKAELCSATVVILSTWRRRVRLEPSRHASTLFDSRASCRKPKAC